MSEGLRRSTRTKRPAAEVVAEAAAPAPAKRRAAPKAKASKAKAPTAKAKAPTAKGAKRTAGAPAAPAADAPALEGAVLVEACKS